MFKVRGKHGLPGNATTAQSVTAYRALIGTDGLWEGMMIGDRRDSLGGHLVLALGEQLYAPGVLLRDS